MSKVIFGDVVRRANTKEDRHNTDKIYYVGGEHIESNEVLIENRGLIEGSTIGPMFYFGFKAGDILFVSRNPHLRKAGMVTFDGICSEKTFVLETKDESVLMQRYLAFVMQSDHFWSYMEAHKSGSVNFFINWSTLEKYEFELPDIDKQKSLSDTLWAINDAKLAYRNLINKTGVLLQSQFIEKFGDVKTNARKYPVKKIEEFATLFAGATPSTKVDAYWNDGTIPWMSSGEVHMGRVTATEKKITQLGYDKSSTKMVPIHTVVMALAGQGKTRGTVAVTEIELCTNQSLCAIVTNESVLSDYLYHNLKNRYEEIRGMCAIAEGRGGLNLKIVGSIPVVVPTIEEQKNFISFAKNCDASVSEMNQAITNLSSLTQSILAENFN